MSYDRDRATPEHPRALSAEAAGGILLLAATILALLWANSPWRASYARLLHAPLGLRISGFAFERDVHFWINDGLMVVFFFVVGIEIKHELRGGQLRTIRAAALPVIAAVGGMAVPGAIYLLLNAGAPAAVAGWGVPMATDIAFAVGVLSLLGKRVTPPMRLLLLALAVIDDLGAILVIALFYSSGFSFAGVAIAACGVVVIVAMQKGGLRSAWMYLPPAVLVWAGAYAAGVHPTIAGVVVGLLTPARVRLGRALHGWVAFGVLPVFALANAGVRLGHANLDHAGTRIVLGVVLGLVLGKPIGIVGFTWLAVRLRATTLPAGINWTGILVVGLVAGIGFTMALFIASLAFPAGPLFEAAKVAILCASATAALIGSGIGRVLLKPETATES